MTRSTILRLFATILIGGLVFGASLILHRELLGPKTIRAHIFPTSMANFYNIYNPDTGTEAGVFVVNNFSNPIQFICAGIASVENSTSQESADKCARYLGPLLNQLTFNYLPTPINPVKGPSARPENLIYTEPHLIPAVVGANESVPAAAPVSSVLDLLFPGGMPR
ncbi:MAG: hypothetical protein WAX14_05815 [Rhodococcus sp. (in: high G+C Gram-positive bacteria)]|uniref:hypothetical protein n=1 Tax=Rhodococcus sp. TaxID=1831 RepID=UPI003BB4A636